jgi:CxxC motif-containing protein (DUF1111 family)
MLMSQSSSSLAFRGPLGFLVIFAVAACERPTPTADASDESAVDALFSNTSVLGGPVSGLTRSQRALFARGREVFTRVFTPETGLGPLFNAEGCAVCHGAPAVGGVGPQIERHASEFTGTACIDHEEINGGAVVQNLATPLLQAAGIFTEDPIAGTSVGRRQSPDLFGFGLIEAIANDDIIRRADPDDRNHDGISGRAVIVESEEEGGETGVGRFGKKGQVPDLLDFITDATIYEQGITSLDEPDEQLVAGNALPDGVDPAADPEITEEDLQASVAFVQMLAPPALVRLNRTQEFGRRIFSDIGCASCHTPGFRTGRHDIAALSGRVFFPYSDFLIHDMGPGLADICMGIASPREFRTEPLMGLKFELAFLHDGSARTVSEAIRRHGGEAARSAEKFSRLSSGQRDALLRFLRTL